MCCICSKLKVDELLAPELAPEPDRIETSRVESTSDVPRRAADDVQIVCDILDELHEQNRDDHGLPVSRRPRADRRPLENRRQHAGGLMKGICAEEQPAETDQMERHDDPPAVQHARPIDLWARSG